MSLFRAASSRSSNAAGSSASSSSHSTAASEPKRQRLPAAGKLVRSSGVLVSEVLVDEYSRRMQLIASRYDDSQDRRHADDHVRKVLGALLLADVRKEDDVGSEHLSRAERGARNLACYVHCVQQMHLHSFLEAGSEVWFKRQLAQYAKYEQQQRCVELALSFLAQLTAGEEPPPEAPAPLRVPAAMSARMTTACPPRTGTVATTAASRNDIKQDCMDSLRESRGFVGEMQALAEAKRQPVLFTAKQDATRGRMLGIGQLQGARAFVQAKVATSTMRETDSFGAPLDEEEEELGDADMDCLAHQPGRRAAPSEAQPRLERGDTYELPAFPRDKLFGWRCKATFPTGRYNGLDWCPGFIIQWQRRADSHVWYRIFFPVDTGTIWFDGDDLPDDSICFRKSHLSDTRVPDKQLKLAQNAVQTYDSDDI